jgi:hypothetical protein
MLPVHHFTEELSRQRFQLLVSTVLESYLMYMVAEIELRIVVPPRKSNIEGWGDHALEVPGNQPQLRLDEAETVRKLDLALEQADAAHIERHAFAFEIQENAIPPG